MKMFDGVTKLYRDVHERADGDISNGEISWASWAPCSLVALFVASACPPSLSTAAMFVYLIHEIHRRKSRPRWVLKRLRCIVCRLSIAETALSELQIRRNNRTLSLRYGANNKK